MYALNCRRLMYSYTIYGKMSRGKLLLFYSTANVFLQITVLLITYIAKSTETQSNVCIHKLVHKYIDISSDASKVLHTHVTISVYKYIS